MLMYQIVYIISVVVSGMFIYSFMKDGCEDGEVVECLDVVLVLCLMTFPMVNSTVSVMGVGYSMFIEGKEGIPINKKGRD